MPAGRPGLAARPTVAQPDELVRLLRIAVTRLGITAVRFTGGEPLFPATGGRGGGHRRAAAAPESLTTNGLACGTARPVWPKPGLDRINVLDSVDPAHFAAITRRDRLDEVAGQPDGGQPAAGLDPVKVNAVLDPVTGRDDLVPLVRFSREGGFHLGDRTDAVDAEHRWDPRPALMADEILAILAGIFSLTPDPRPRGSAPPVVAGRRWPATVGIIASVSRPFCGACDRTRLTADGQVRNCLFASTETDLRTLLRDGGTDDEIDAAWRAAMWGKGRRARHQRSRFVQPARPMSAIGG